MRLWRHFVWFNLGFWFAACAFGDSVGTLTIYYDGPADRALQVQWGGYICGNGQGGAGYGQVVNGSSQVVHFNVSGVNGQYDYLDVEMLADSNGNPHCDTGHMVVGTGFNLIVHLSGSGVVWGNTNCYSAKLHALNDTATGMGFLVSSNGATVGAGYLGAGKVLDLALGTNCGGWYSANLSFYDPLSGQYVTDPSWTQYATNAITASGSGGGHTYSQSPGGQTPAGDSSGANRTWSTNAPDVGSSAIVDAVSRVGAQLHDDLSRLGSNGFGGIDFSGLSNGIGKLDADLVNYGSAISNGLAVSDGWALTNAQNWKALLGSSNWADWSGVTNFSVQTNRAGAMLDGSGFNSAVAGASSAMGDMPSGDYGTYSGLDVPLGSYTMHLDPFGGEWGTMWSYMREFARWFLIAAYVMAICKDTYLVVQTLGTAQQVRIPVINVLGNNLGAAAYPLLIGTLLVLYGMVLGMVSQILIGDMSLIHAFAHNPFAGVAGAVGNGIAYLGMAFPLDTLFSLTGAYCVWRLTMSGGLAFFVSAVRTLAG